MSRRSERVVFQITMLVIALLFYVLLSTAHAGSISLHTGSKHAGGCDTCNEENWGIGWTGDGDVAWTGGYYTNSWFRHSFYAGGTMRFTRSFSASVVGISGYAGVSDNEMLFGELLVAPLVHWRALPGAPVSPLVTYAPTPDGGVALFSVNWRY